VEEELERVHHDLANQEAAERANIDAKRWKMKYKYKYYYKYKAEAEEEEGLQQSQVLGDMWDIDPAVADVEAKGGAAAAASTGSTGGAVSRSVGGRPTPIATAGHQYAYTLGSPPQLGRGDQEDDEDIDLAGDQQVEFYLHTEEVDEEPVAQIARQSKRQAAAFLVKVHEVGLANKELRKQMIPQQRGMKQETKHWENLELVVTQKGNEEAKAALRSKDIKAVTSQNVARVVSFLADALEAKLDEGSPQGGGSPVKEERPLWDSSQGPEGRFRYLKREKLITGQSRPEDPRLKSPQKLGWDHDQYYKSGGTATGGPATCIQKYESRML
jgi:hypothetical protein